MSTLKLKRCRNASVYEYEDGDDLYTIALWLCDAGYWIAEVFVNGGSLTRHFQNQRVDVLVRAQDSVRREMIARSR